MTADELAEHEEAQLVELGRAVDNEVELRLAAQNQRTLGTVIVASLTGIAGGTLGVVGLAASAASDVRFKEMISSVQPGTIIVAVIAALGGLAAGVGLRDK